MKIGLLFFGLLAVPAFASTHLKTQGTRATRTAPGAREPIPPHALYEDIPAGDLEAMTHARKIELRVNGSTEAILGDLDPRGQELLGGNSSPNTSI